MTSIPVKHLAVDDHLGNGLCLAIETRAARGKILYRSRAQRRVDRVLVEYDNVRGPPTRIPSAIPESEKVRGAGTAQSRRRSYP